VRAVSSGCPWPSFPAYAGRRVLRLLLWSRPSRLAPGALIHCVRFRLAFSACAQRRFLPRASGRLSRLASSIASLSSLPPADFPDLRRASRPRALLPPAGFSSLRWMLRPSAAFDQPPTVVLVSPPAVPARSKPQLALLSWVPSAVPAIHFRQRSAAFRQLERSCRRWQL